MAFFPDAYHEVDGVAVVARNFRHFAHERRLPFLLFHAGASNECVREGTVTRVGLRRSRMSFPLDRAHDFDMAFMRHYARAAEMLSEFRPDYIQITGPGDVGILGMALARKMKIPLAAFWQTDLPQYAGLRARQGLAHAPRLIAEGAMRAAKQVSGFAVNGFYKLPKLLFAPNPEIAGELARTTGKPVSIMGHGVDLKMFDPEKRKPEKLNSEECDSDRHTRATGVGAKRPFTIGYVGRLSSEKNVRMLAAVEAGLAARGLENFRFLIVGQGAEDEWLRSRMRHVEITGVLHGDALAKAFASMDVLAFPSETDTFGLAVLEALASGVPAVVTDRGGPQYTVRHGETGYVARGAEEFAKAITTLMVEPELLARMRTAAREYANGSSWDRAFEGIYRAYREHGVSMQQYSDKAAEA